MALSQLPGRSTIARTLPVDGWMTTMSTGFVVVDDSTAPAAASWYDIMMLVFTGRPWTALKVRTVLACLPGPASLIVSEGALVGLLDAALADEVTRLVGRSELLRLGSRRLHDDAGQQRDRPGLSPRRGRAEHGPVRGVDLRPRRPGAREREPLPQPQPGVNGRRAPVHPPAPVPHDQPEASLVRPRVVAGQAVGDGEPGHGPARAGRHRTQS